MTKKDIVADIIGRFLAAAPETFSEDLADEIERQVRHEWGGTQVKIAKRSAAHKRAEVAREIRAGTPIAEIQAATGVSRATLYRLLRSPANGPTE